MGSLFYFIFYFYSFYIIMGSILSCCACQAASCCASAACSCCSNAVGGCKGSTWGRVGYVILFTLCAIVAFFFRVWGEEVFGNLLKYHYQYTDDQLSLFNIESTYKILFAVALYHAMNAILMIGCKTRGDIRCSIQEGWWGFKMIIIGALMVACWFIGSEFYSVYGIIAAFGAGFFILIQLVLLIDFAHSWNESWLEKVEDEDNQNWFYALLTATVVFYLGALGFTIASFILYCQHGQTLNTILICINVSLCFFTSMASVHSKIQDVNPRVGLLQASILSIYSSYLCFSALLAQPTKMNEQADVTDLGFLDYVVLVCGSVFSILAVVYSTYNASNSEKVTGGKGIQLLAKDEEEGEDDVNNNDDDEDPDETVGYNYTYFHISFILGSMYILMLFVNWTTSSSIYMDTGSAAYWIKFASSWLCHLLYGWSLIAPLVLSDRDFGY